MSEVCVQEEENKVGNALPGGPDATAGGLLRMAREAHGLPLAGLAAALKVPVAKLQALEDNDWAQLPDMAFTRALALSVCRAMHLDATPVLALLPKGDPRKWAPTSAGLNAPFKDRSPKSALPVGGGAGSRKGLYLVAGLLVAAAAVYWGPVDEVAQWAQRWNAEPAQEQGAPQPVVSAPVAVVEPTAAQLPAAALETPAAAASEGAAPAVPAAPADASATAPAAAAPAPAASETPTAEPAAGPGPSATATLAIRAAGATWIQVKDAAGAQLVQKTLQAGEWFETAAGGPLSVVIGRADGTEVMVKGKAFDLAPIARENVARFEVK